MPAAKVVVTVDGGADLAVLESEARRLGMTEIAVLASLGLLTGAIDAAALGKLREIPGVRAVELERTNYRSDSSARS